MCIPVPESVSQWPDTSHTTDDTSESGDFATFCGQNLQIIRLHFLLKFINGHLRQGHTDFFFFFFFQFRPRDSDVSSARSR